MRPLVIYHANCADGYGAAFAAWLTLQDTADYEPAHYGDADQRVRLLETCTDRLVYVLDFSFPREYFDRLARRAANVCLIDHHKTAFEEFGVVYHEEAFELLAGPGYRVQLDNRRSGAYLAWEHFHGPENIPALILDIDDRDRWVFSRPTSAALHAGLRLLGDWSFQQWEDLLSDEHYQALLRDGETALAVGQQLVRDVSAHATPCTITHPQTGVQYSGRAVNCPVHQSDLGHALTAGGADFGLVWYRGAGGRVICSLRSRGEYDVSVIARAFGGGGHRNAAGCSVSMAVLAGWLA